MDTYKEGYYIDENPKRNEVDASLIREVVYARKKLWDEIKQSKQDKIQEARAEGKKITKTEMDRVEEYSVFKKNDPTIILGEKVEEIQKIVSRKTKTDRLEDLIDRTGNKQATNAIRKQKAKHRREGNDLKKDADKILSDPNKKPKLLSEPDCNYVVYVNPKDDGFLVTSEIERVDIYSDAYSDLFRTALENQMHELNINTDKSLNKEKDPMVYVEKEMQELEEVEDFWKSDTFKIYLEGLRKSDTKKAEKYSKAQSKKKEKVKELMQLYQDIAENRATIDKVDQTLEELRRQETNLPKNVYKKILKGLTTQKKKAEKEKNKQESKKESIFRKTGLRYSIDSAKEYETKVSEIEALRNTYLLEEDLAKMQQYLRQAEAVLYGEYEKGEAVPVEPELDIRDGDAYERNNEEKGNEEYGFVTNQEAIKAAEARVAEIKRRIEQQKESIEKNKRMRSELKETINSIVQGEVDTTIKAPENKAQQALPEANSSDKRKREDWISGFNKVDDYDEYKENIPEASKEISKDNKREVLDANDER